MPSGFTTGGADLDDVFDPYVEGTKPAATGYTAAGIDLNQRYAPLTYGAAAAATGMKIAGGADCNTLWAAKGSAVYSHAVVPGFGNYEADSNGPHSTGASITCAIRNDGTWTVVAVANPGGVGGGGFVSGTPTSGAWLSSGSAADYEVRFTADVTVTGTLPDQSHSASTGWQACGTDREIDIDAGSYGGGDSEANGTISGSYFVEIRKIGSATGVSDYLNFQIMIGSG